jgi:signal transduction histidine kinase/streptogramin lyase
MGLQRFQNGELRPYKTPNWDSSSVGVEALLLDRQHALWVGTIANGLFRIRDGKVDHYGSEDGLTSDHVINLFQDREGNVWVATDKGVDCFHDLAVTSFTAREGLRATEVDTVLAASDGTIWSGGAQSLDALRDSKVVSLQTGKGLPGQQVTSLLEDHEGRLWVGIDHTMSILKDGQFTPIKRPDGTPLGFVVGIAEDIENNVWAEISGTPRELIRIKDLKVRDVFPAPQMPAARKVAADPEGGIWLGLMNGDLARYRQGKLETFHFPHESDTLVNEVRVDADGAVLGATAYGLISWRAGKQQVMSSRNGLPCDGINAFIRDNEHALWLYAECGLIQISGEELQKWWEHPDRTLQFRVFDAIDGVQPGLVPFQVTARSPDGKLWFVSAAGLQMIDPAHVTKNAILPPVHVEGLVADGRAISGADGMQVPALTRDVAIRYTAPSFVAPQRVLFRYRLEGQDKGWQDAGTRREAFYTNLAPGNYRFRVIASNNDGLWNEEGDSVSFTIAPAYYQTKWFAVLCILAIGGVLWSLYLLRLRQAREKVEQRLLARLEERERISRELHDTLLQGFQGIVLRFQAVMKVLPDREPGRELMGKVLDRADQVLVDARQSVQGLRAESKSLVGLSEALTKCAQELGDDGDTEFRLSVLGAPYALTSAFFEEIYRIVREALVNAFSHSKAPLIELELTYSSESLRIRIRDNGVGIDPEVVCTGRSGHWGLLGMRERAAGIGATLNILSGPEVGTEVDLTVPKNVLAASDGKDSARGRIKWIKRSQGWSEEV